MPKVTVADIFQTRKNLVRFNNYARNHMDALPIEQMNEQMQEARNVLSSMIVEFDQCDVTTLTPDLTTVYKDIEHAESKIEYHKRELKADKKKLKKALKGTGDAEPEYWREWIERDENNLAHWEMRLAALNEKLK